LKNQVLGWYSNGHRRIEESSASETPYQARWYRRTTNKEDPWITLHDHSGSVRDGEVLYGENKFGNIHASNVLPVNNGANVWIRLSTEGTKARQRCQAARDGEDGWTWVRHVPSGDKWHPAKDQLTGSEAYGSKGTQSSDPAWSIKFDSIDFDEFMFATGDCQKWMRVKKDQVYGWYSNAQREVEESSTSERPYKARWYRRANNREDPWITLRDHSTSVKEGEVLYGENNFGNIHASNVLPVHNGADVYVRMSADGKAKQQECREAHDGWTLVRHVPPGNMWHPAKDQLVGTEVYGTPSGDHGDKAWTVRYDTMDYDEFMFSTGDCLKWLIAKKTSVFGWYSNAQRDIEKSSSSDRPYKARWYRRANNKEDPWITIHDHSGSVRDGEVLYGENKFGNIHASNVVAVNNGANVWIRLTDHGEKVKERCEEAKKGMAGWQLVRHVPAGHVWHPATDKLMGSDVYGKESHDEAAPAWSIRFENINYDEFMFATGDCQKWLVAKKDAVFGWYSNNPRDIVESSISNKPYKARWYRRANNKEDPWISITDHSAAVHAGEIVYGANSFGNVHASNVVAVHNGADVYVRLSPDGAAAEAKCNKMHDGWSLVRHVPPGLSWHPAEDQLIGAEVYGPAGDADKAWTVRWDQRDYDEFIFSTGDCQKWLMTKKSQVFGWYSNTDRQIEASSLSDRPYEARWYRRANNKEDPWITLRDHSESVRDGEVMYGEDKFGNIHASNVLPIHNGADVWMRLSEEGRKQQEGCLAAREGRDGWQLVRRVGPGHMWHPATDQLIGSDVYGSPEGFNSTKAWSVPFNTLDYDEFMFATGDCLKWLITKKDTVFAWYSNGHRTIESSSASDQPYQARWYRRTNNREDPWITLHDHSGSVRDGEVLYGENKFGNIHASNVLPVNNGANVYVRLSSGANKVQGPCRGAAAGEDGWKLVRRVGPGYKWHPATDQLTGTDLYGTKAGPNSSSAWSIPFNTVDYDEFMFTTGDCSKWLVTKKDTVLQWYSNGHRQIESSSISDKPYEARWYRRTNNKEDPWITLRDHSTSVPVGEVLYGENKFGNVHAGNVLPAYNGANVYVRLSADANAVQGPCREAAAGKAGWKLVRRVGPGYKWHPATDQLLGTDEYGTPAGPQAAEAFSVKFDDQDFKEFMFTTGDCSKWLIATKESVLDWYSNANRQIESSSISGKPYTARWYRRTNNKEDPWITLRDHSTSVRVGEVLYGENNFGNIHASYVLPAYNGANVYIRS